MSNLDQGGNAAPLESVETKLGGWECIVIKCFAILFLILFLSEKAVKEMGSIRRTWSSEITAPLGPAAGQSPVCSCLGTGSSACCRRASLARLCATPPDDRR